jgi:ferritin-like metal-binding protein YciE
MTATAARDLLILAMQDLHDGEIAWQERIASLKARLSDAALIAFADEQGERSAGQADRLQQVADKLGVPPRAEKNIWLRAILDDARRDTEMIAGGPLLDTALIGAMRKAVQSERVSYETAIHVAAALGMAEIAALLDQSHTEELAADAKLLTLLQRLAAETV